jgi:hypothetical protein
MLTIANAFTQTEIAAAINIVPNTYGRINQLGLMPVRGVMTRDIAIEEQNGSLALIPTEAIGGAGTVGQNGKRRIRTFRVPRLIQEEHVNPAEVDGIRAFGGDARESLAALLNQKLSTVRAKHDITLEYLRMGALKGIILDADGSSVVYNLYNEFGITQKTIDFDLLPANKTDVRAKCMELVRYMEDNLMGESSSGVRALVSSEFFDKLVAHPSVKEAYANYQEAAQRLGGDMRDGFTFGSVTFEEYRGRASGTGGTIRFIAANEGHAFPVGTTNTFATLAAPADFNDTVGKLGQVYYAKVQEAKMGRGYDIHTQANVLPMCMRPAVLVKVHTST